MSTADDRVRATSRGRPSSNPLALTPTEERLKDGQYADHWVLSPEELAKGFVRPVRLSYVHVGPPGPAHPLVPLSEEQKDENRGVPYVGWETYPPDRAPLIGRYWTQPQLDAVAAGGCGAVTTMGLRIAETYAAKPSFYGSTFCCGCKLYLPVGSAGEFVWEGTAERVGT